MHIGAQASERERERKVCKRRIDAERDAGGHQQLGKSYCDAAGGFTPEIDVYFLYFPLENSKLLGTRYTLVCKL